MVQDFQSAHPDAALMVVGDLNAFQFTDGYVDVIGQICGDLDPEENLLSGPDLVDPDLTIEVLRLPRAQRYSHVYQGSAAVLDHVLTNHAAAPLVTGLAYGRGNADAPHRLIYQRSSALRASDHDGLVVYLDTGSGGGGGGGGGGGQLFLSEYVEGSSNNKAIEIYNANRTAVDLGADRYRLEIYFNGETTSRTIIDLDGTVAPGRVWVVADEDATGSLLSRADQTSGANFFNGNDAVVLKKAGEVVDAFGRMGENPGEQWSNGGVRTKDRTLRRKQRVCQGDTVRADRFDPSDEWVEHPRNTFSGLGRHTADCGGL